MYESVPASEVNDQPSDGRSDDDQSTRQSEQVPGLQFPSPELCVICLDLISNAATAIPCRHDHFHFTCLGTWLQNQQRCPLCKEVVRAVRYKADCGSQIFQLPQDEAILPQRRFVRRQHHRAYRGYPHDTNLGIRTRQASRALKNFWDEDPAVTKRRHIYANNLYSLHVGSNRHSRYLPSGSITPQLFNKSPHHLSRAKIFIRRELKVFDFLDPASASSKLSTFNGTERAERPSRRVTNREYLLEYIIAILHAIPLKGSEGQAEKLLAEYLGVGNARLFLHELEAWLRSPFERIEEWDAAVQYSDIVRPP